MIIGRHGFWFIGISDLIVTFLCIDFSTHFVFSVRYFGDIREHV